MIGLGLAPLVDLKTYKVVPKRLPNGFYVFKTDGGFSLRCNPNADGSFANFDLDGTNEGAYEQCEINGGIVTYFPLGKALPFFYTGMLPNG